MSSKLVGAWRDTKYLNRKCSVKGCHAPSLGGLPTLHTYPKEKELQEKWIEFVSKTHNNHKRIRWGAICSLHFKDEDFENLNIVKMGFGRRLRLKRDAVPVIYPNMINVESMSRFQELRNSTKPSGTRNMGKLRASAPAVGNNNGTTKRKLSIEEIMKALKKTQESSQNVVVLQNSKGQVSKNTPTVNGNGAVNCNASQRKWLKVKIVCKRKIPKPSLAGTVNAKDSGEPVQKKLKENPETSATVQKLPSASIVEKDHISNSASAKDGKGVGDDYIKEILHSMYSMQKNGTLCDFSLVTSSSPTSQCRSMTFVKVHRVVFAAVSEKIQNHRSDAIKLAENIQTDDLLHVIEFVYTGKMKQIKDFSILQVTRVCNAAAALDIVKCVKYLQTNRPDAVEFAIPEIVEKPCNVHDYAADESINTDIPEVRVKEEYDPSNVVFYPTLPKNDAMQSESDGEGTSVQTQPDDDKCPTSSTDAESDSETNSTVDGIKQKMLDSSNLNCHATTQPVDPNDTEPSPDADNSCVVKQETIDPEFCSLSPFVLQISHRKNVMLE